MSSLDKFYEPILNTLQTMLFEGKLSTDTQLDIYLAIKKAAKEMQENQLAQLQDKISKWEEVVEGVDSSLYTLGLRHAMDIVEGKVATDTNGYDGQPYV